MKCRLRNYYPAGSLFNNGANMVNPRENKWFCWDGNHRKREKIARCCLVISDPKAVYRPKVLVVGLRAEAKRKNNA
jgi:hypothetical protein